MSYREGYTATEALAALAILGMAFGGLTTSMVLIGLGQAKARDRLEQSVRERAADEQLQNLLALSAPFRSDQPHDLVGEANALELDCGAAKRCRAIIEDGTLTLVGRSGQQSRLHLPSGQNPHFVFVGSYGQSPVWPPAPQPPPAPAWQTLTAVMIQSQSPSEPKPLVMAKVWRQQHADCEYDVVIQDCRGMTP